MVSEFEVSESLKNHYDGWDIRSIIDEFLVVFKHEKKYLLDRFERGYLDDKGFSNTIFNISDLIVYRYINDELNFLDRAFICSNKFKEYPFHSKIFEFKIEAKRTLGGGLDLKYN